ncbi:hypothetical protein XENOCAPTIV_018212, partial [Xenoophorus captivus]
LRCGPLPLRSPGSQNPSLLQMSHPAREEDRVGPERPLRRWQLLLLDTRPRPPAIRLGHPDDLALLCVMELDVPRSPAPYTWPESVFPFDHPLWCVHLAEG